MNATKGYFSVIQYCPDSLRAESANIGVLLYCPELGYLDIRMAQGNDRVTRFFGRKSYDASRLADAKHAIEHRIRLERDRFRSLADLEQFISTRGASITLTAPRPTKVTDPPAELSALFAKLVGVRQNKLGQPKDELTRNLKQIFDRPSFNGLILHNQQVTVPVTSTVLKAPYAFQNGTLNLIYPIKLNSRTVSAAKEAAIEGALLSKHREEMEFPASLWVTLAQPSNSDLIRERDIAATILRDHDIRTYREEQLEALAADVAAAAH